MKYIRPPIYEIEAKSIMIPNRIANEMITYRRVPIIWVFVLLLYSFRGRLSSG